MKETSFLKVIVAAVLAVIFQFFAGTSSARTTTESYPLVCRGGGSLVIGIAPGERNFGFTFTRGTKPAREGLAPGECSWEDRGMYPNEPDRVSQHVEADSESLKVGGKLAPENRWYEELYSADNSWTFMVFNNGRGQLIATSARPNGAMDVSPTARVPPRIGQILRRDLPKARTVDDETPKLIVLKGPAEPSSKTEMLEGLSVERNLNIPPAPRSLSTEEKTALLGSAGLKPYSDPPTPYVTFTPQEPNVTGRGRLTFYNPMFYGQAENGAAFRMNDSPDVPNSLLEVELYFDSPGMYLMTFTVRSMGYLIRPIKPITSGDSEVFVFTSSDGSKVTILGKNTIEWQRLNLIVEMAKPGKYYFGLEVKSKNTKIWLFHSCEVSAWNK